MHGPRMEDKEDSSNIAGCIVGSMIDMASSIVLYAGRI